MTFKSLVELIVNDIFGPLVGLIFALAFLYFLWGVAEYVRSSSGDDKRQEAVTKITYGLVGLFVMVSVWGLVAVLQNTFNLDNSNPRQKPPGTQVLPPYHESPNRILDPVFNT